MAATDNKWFESWFDTCYYKLLYSERNESEAELLINNLIRKLSLSPGSKIWDLACGAGRHSFFLAKQGMNVIGTDLSSRSLEEAKQYESGNLEFYKLDMRSPFRIRYFDVVLNLFTSFGYFENSGDELKVFRSVSNSLKENGLFVLDYFNAEVILKEMKVSEKKVMKGVEFDISKSVVKGRILKKIKINDDGNVAVHEESVALHTLDNFEKYAAAVGLSVVEVYGNYKLEAFDKNTSPRLIVLMKKVK